MNKDRPKLHAAIISIKKDTPVKVISCQCLKHLTPNSLQSLRMNKLVLHYLEVAVHRFSTKQAFSKLLQYSQKPPVFECLPYLKACNFIKKRLEHRYFPVNIEKLLGAAFL